MSGTKSSDFGTTKRENHDSRHFYSSKMYSEIKPALSHGSDGLENAFPKNLENTIIKGDSQDLSVIPDLSIHLVVSSPPYNTRKQYDEDLSLTEYLSLIENVCREIYPKLVDGGRLILNIANLGRKPYIPLSDYISHILTRLGYFQRGEVIWDKGSSAGSSTAWGCYDDQTRVLTNNGLKYFEELDIENDLFATINPVTKHLEYQEAFDYIEQKYEGDMYHIKSSNFDLLITPNHNMLLSNNYLDTLYISSIAEMSQLSNFTIPQKHAGYREGLEKDTFILSKADFGKRTKGSYHATNQDRIIEMDLWLKFLGYFLTDGNAYLNAKTRNYSVSIYQSKEPYTTEIREIFEKLPFKYVYKDYKNEFKILSKQLCTYLSQFGIKDQRTIPDFIFELSVRQKKIFVEYMFRGDGSFRKTGEYRYFATQSPQVFNKMLNLLTQCGFTYSYYIQEALGETIVAGKLSNTTKDVFRIEIKKSKDYHIRKRNIKLIPYSGKIFCVSVQNETLLVERNGRFSWCGNSWKSSTNPCLRDVHEYILVFSKGTMKRSKGEKNNTITRDEFLEYTKSIWQFSTVSAKRIGHPAPFPKELPYRCIQLYSLEDDMIFDPFMGSGSTALAAIESNRRFFGIDLDDKYVELANDRVEKLKMEKESKL